jgi:hypothetical protein
LYIGTVLAINGNQPSELNVIYVNIEPKGKPSRERS